MATRLYLSMCVITIMIIVDCNVISRLQLIEDRLTLLEGKADTERSSHGISKQCRNWRQDFMQVTKAFKNEKMLNAKIRDQFPRVVHGMQVAEIAMDTIAKTFDKVNVDISKVVDDMQIMMNKRTSNQMTLGELVLGMAEVKNASFEIPELKNQLANVKEISNLIYSGRPKSCKKLYENWYRTSNQYDVYPVGGTNPTRVFCDQDTAGGGWTVFQRRQDGSENFFRGWLDYKNGFGDLNGEFWLGNEHLSVMTSKCCHQLRIDMESFDGEKTYAMYDTFQIESESQQYSLKVGGYSGNAGDSLYHHNGRQFTTKDRDNDRHSRNCAIQYTGAWWYDMCYVSNLNGQYLARQSDSRGITWYHFGYSHNSLKFVEMKFR